jgi:hypothetical protein
MRKSLTTLAAGFALAALSESASAQVAMAPPAPMPLAQAQAPAFAVGEEWEFAYTNVLEPRRNNNFTQRVVSVAGGQTVLAVGDGRAGPTVLDASGNIMSAGGGAYEPSDGRLQFPLAVGKAWSISYVYKSGSWISHCDREAKVIGVERIDTPAGPLDAFKIEQKTSWSGNDQYGGHGVTHETDWYAPAVGRIARLDYQDIPVKGPATTTHVELARWRPAPP